MTRAPVRLVVAVVVATTLVSGPLVDSVDITRQWEAPDSPFCERSGSANVEIQEVHPDSFALRQQDYGARTYFVDGDPTVVAVSDVTGCPIVSYVLRIPELGFFSRRVYFVGARERPRGTNAPDGSRNLSITVVGGHFNPESIDRSVYDGRLVVRVLGDRNRTVYRANVTIEVDE